MAQFSVYVRGDCDYVLSMGVGTVPLPRGTCVVRPEIKLWTSFRQPWLYKTSAYARYLPRKLAGGGKSPPVYAVLSPQIVAAYHDWV